MYSRRISSIRHGTVSISACALAIACEKGWMWKDRGYMIRVNYRIHSYSHNRYIVMFFAVDYDSRKRFYKLAASHFVYLLYFYG